MPDRNDIPKSITREQLIDALAPLLELLHLTPMSIGTTILISAEQVSFDAYLDPAGNEGRQTLVRVV